MKKAKKAAGRDFSACKRLKIHVIMKFMSDGRAHDEQTIKRYTELAKSTAQLYIYLFNI